MQVYIDKLSNGGDKIEQSHEGNPPSCRTVSRADSQIIAERIIKDIVDRINNICKSDIGPKQYANSNLSEADSASELKKETISGSCNGSLRISGTEPAPEIYKNKSIREDNNYIYNTIDENGKLISREISLKHADFIIKNF